jgi:hypothetical protein
MSRHSAQSAPSGHHRRGRKGSRLSTRSKIVSGVVGAILAGGMAYAATNWLVGLANNSSGQAQSATVSNLSIDAVASPSPNNLLYPGATGDVVVKITNPNEFPVTITAVDLPADSTYASGFSDSVLSTPQTGCESAASHVSWTGATASSGSAHTLDNAIVVDASSNTTVTFTNAATMELSAPAACEATYFAMPSFTGVSASGGSGTATTFATDSWS